MEKTRVDYIENGDCLCLMKGMEDKTVDIVFTSPPYNRKRNDKYEFYDDTIDDYYSFLCDVTDECLRLCKRYVVINIQKNYYNKQDVFRFMGKYADRILEVIVWEKTNPLPASGKSITNAYEFFVFLSDENKALSSNATYTKNIISSSVNNDTQKDHKAVMKKSVCDWFIENFSNENDIVLDPFMGTGTTAISCKERNRHYIGFEISEKYYRESLDRINGVARIATGNGETARQISIFEGFA